MNGLDLPLEALTFIPVNLATVISSAANNHWAWLAVITATLSLWRFRTTATKTTSSLISLPPPPPPTTTTPTPTKPTSTTTTTRTPSFKCTDDIMQKQEEEGELTRGNSKKFFSVYFEERENINQLDEGEDEYDDDDDDDEMMEGGDEVENESRVVMMKRWGPSSELTVEMRRGNFGWYSHQNRKVIDGSVVRLWKEEREDGCCGSPWSCRGRRATALVLA